MATCKCVGLCERMHYYSGARVCMTPSLSVKAAMGAITTQYVAIKVELEISTMPQAYALVPRVICCCVQNASA